MHNSEQPPSLALDSRRVLNLPKSRDSGYSRRYQGAEVSRANETNCKGHLLLIREDEMGTDDNITEPRTGSCQTSTHGFAAPSSPRLPRAC